MDNGFLAVSEVFFSFHGYSGDVPSFLSNFYDFGVPLENQKNGFLNTLPGRMGSMFSRNPHVHIPPRLKAIARVYGKLQGQSTELSRTDHPCGS